MINTILGSKGKNSQTYVEGSRIAVTKVTAGPCVVTQIKRMDKDGYWAIQLGFGSRKVKNTSKSLQGHLKIALKDNTLPRNLKEVRTTEEPTVKVGDVVNASDIFNAGDVISVSAISKGKGYAGVIKKHGFHGGPKTHGQSDRERSPGSIGQTTTPGRVYRGKRMAGRMGSEQVTIKNLHIISVNKETNEIEISGQIPGTIGSLVTVNKLKAGSLEDLTKEVVAQVVEGEGESSSAPEGASEGQGKPEEVKTEEVKA